MKGLENNNNATNIIDGVDSISFVNYTTSTLHNQLDAYLKSNNLVKNSLQAISTEPKSNTTQTYLIKKDNQVLFKYKTTADRYGSIYNILEFNGLKSLNEEKDKDRKYHLLGLLEYLTYKGLLNKWKIRSLDICFDLGITNDKVIVTKGKSKGNRIATLDTRIDTKTQYIEKVPTKKLAEKEVLDRNNMLMSAYFYDKRFKELSKNGFDMEKDITRFEIKLLPRLFKKLSTFTDVKVQVQKYTLKTYSSKNKCNQDKILANKRKALLGGYTEALQLDNTYSFLLELERLVGFDLVEENKNKVVFDLEDFI